MTEKEAEAIEILQKKIRDKKISTFEYLVSVSRLDARGLEVSGYRGKSNAQAMEMIVESAKKELEKLVDAHIKQFPDEK